MRSPLSIAAALSIAALPAAASAGLAETWYLSRGRANLEIANYAAAIEAFRKVLEEDPGNREASRSLGLALQRNGETDAAVAQFGRHLERFPEDADVAFELARVLQWSRYAYRAGDAVRYLRLGLRTRDEPVRRRELARLLGRAPDTRDEAIAEYRKLLARAPADRGLRDEYLKLLLWDRRHRDEAIAELERRVAESPQDERLGRDLARLLAEDPRRADEAARRYGALLARRPQDPDLRLGRARALARMGRRGEALEDYDRVVAARPAAYDVRVERADVLAGTPDGREEARGAYEAVLRERPGHRGARLGLARLLGARKETAPEAIRAYRAVLAEAPRDAEAHRGLARAYAWEGQSDRALQHAGEARRLGREGADLASLTRSLRTGREPALGGAVRTLGQGGGAARLSRTAGLVRGEADPTPFSRGELEVGWADARGPAGAAASGLQATGGLTVRSGEAQRFRLGLGWDGARRRGGLGGELAFERGGQGDLLRLAVLRSPRLDSFRAYAGERLKAGGVPGEPLAGGALAGAASETCAELRYGHARSARLGFETSARAGAVSAAGVSPALLAAVSARLGYALVRAGTWTVGTAVAASAAHHGRDLSAAAEGGRGPGLFSPPLFATASPRLTLSRDAGASGWLTLDAGPSVQGIAGPGGGVRLGGDASLALSQRFGGRLRAGAELRAEQVATAYRRLEAGLTLALLFP